MSDLRKVLFVGIGNMGWPMAARLIAAGFELKVSDVQASRAAEFAGQVGGVAIGNLPEAAAQSDLVITMLPTSRQVADVVAAARAGLKRGQLVVDMSSGAPAATRAIADDLATIGVSVVDAPVSGGVSRAVTGELAIMTGGDPAALDRVEPLLRAMGTTIHRIGPVGAGQAMKALTIWCQRAAS